MTDLSRATSPSARIGRHTYINTLVRIAGLVLVLAVAALIGRDIAHGQTLSVGLAFAVMIGLILLTLQPFVVFLGVVLLSPLTATWVGIPLPAGIPDISVDRMLVVVALGGLLLRHLQSGKRSMPGLSPADGLLLIHLFTVLAVAVVLSKNLSAILFVFVETYAMPVIVYFLTRALVRSEDRVRVLLIIVVVVSLYLSLGAVFELATGTKILAKWKPYYEEGTPRIGSFVRGGWTYALLVLMCLALSLFAFRRTDSRALKVLYGAAILLAAVTVPFTLVRSTWVAGGLLFLLEMVGFKRMRVNLLIIGAFLVIIIGYISSRTDLPLGQSLVRRVLSQQLQVPFDHRVELSRTAWESFLRSPIAGVGLEEARYQGSLLGVQGVHSHNTFLTILSGIGLIGVAPLVLAWAVILVSSIRDYFRLPAGHWGREWLFALWGAVLVFFVVASAVDFTIIPVALVFFYLVMGLISRTPDFCAISPVQEVSA